MKTPIAAAVLLLGTHLSFAEHDAAYYQPAPAVVYDQPVVYQAPVVYTAPVVYNAPVTYQVVTPVATPVVTAVAAPAYPVVNMAVNPVYQPYDPAYRPVVYQPGCASPNVIVAGQGAYHRSWNTTPTVIHIGGGHANRGSLPTRIRWNLSR